MTYDKYCSNVVPEPYRTKLINASIANDRIEQIDKITDELVTIGVCRPRDDVSEAIRKVKRDREYGKSK